MDNFMMNVVFDLDGTLANLEHRLHLIQSKPKNWRAFNAGISQDKPIYQIILVARALFYAGNRIIFASGREGTERTRNATRAWLYNYVGGWTDKCSLFMRKPGDYRKDFVVKEEILLNNIVPTFGMPDLVFDDRLQVVEMWRSYGIRVAQVAKGDF